VTNPPDIARTARLRRIPWGPVAWIGILVAIGFVQLVRAQWFDAAVFLVVAAVLSLDAMLVRPRARAGGPARLVPILVVAAGAVAMTLPRHGTGMQLLLCGTGLVVLLLSWRQTAVSGEPWAPGQARLARIWALIVVVGCLWELGEFLLGRARPGQPAFALSDLLDPLLSSGAGKAVFVIAWIAGGCFLVTRGRR